MVEELESDEEFEMMVTEEEERLTQFRRCLRNFEDFNEEPELYLNPN